MVAVAHTRQCVTADGSSETITDNGVAADLNMHQFPIVKGSGAYLFYIDGVLVATNTTHLPLTGVGGSDLVQMDARGSSSGLPAFRVG